MFGTHKQATGRNKPRNLFCDVEKMPLHKVKQLTEKAKKQAEIEKPVKFVVTKGDRFAHLGHKTCRSVGI